MPDRPRSLYTIYRMDSRTGILALCQCRGTKCPQSEGKGEAAATSQEKRKAAWDDFLFSLVQRSANQKSA